MTSGFSYSGTELDALAGARNYYRAIIDHFRPHFGRRVLEVGAGIGTFARHVLDETSVEEMLLLEPADNTISVLRDRFAGVPRITVTQGYLEQLSPVAQVDSVVAVNVIEHVENDVGFLRAAHGTLKPGGKVLLFTPALSQIFGTLDEAFGHFRRYTKTTLGERLRAAGFENVRLRYTNFPGIASWFLAGRVLRRRTIAPRDVAVYDRLVMPWVAAMERHWEPPLGQSVIAIATRGSL
jgi:SAM-dependent methyltransferase